MQKSDQLAISITRKIIGRVEVISSGIKGLLDSNYPWFHQLIHQQNKVPKKDQIIIAIKPKEGRSDWPASRENCCNWN